MVNYMQALDNEVLKNKILQSINQKSNTIGIELTTYCPLDCIYCTRKLNERRDKHLSLEDAKLLLERIKDFQRVVICGIGEPFVYPYLYDVLDKLSSKKVVLITSGTVKIDYERLRHSNCVEVLIFSVDSPSEEGMKEIASAYNWDNLIYNLQNARGFTRMINCTVTEETYKLLPETAQFAVDHHLSAVSYTLDIRREKSEDSETIRKVLDEAKNIATRNRLVFVDNSTQFKCMSWGQLVHYINLDGDFFPCCQGVNTKYSVGNIFRESFEQILEGEAYKQFQTGFKCLEGCRIYSDRVELSNI